MIIDIESQDVQSTFQQGMTENVKILFVQQLVKYISSYLKKIKN